MRKLETHPDRKRIIKELHSFLGERFTQSEVVCNQHGCDEAYHAPQPPEAVAFIKDDQEIVQLIKLCSEHEIPIIPFGSGTSLEAQVLAPTGGICINLMAMNQILKVSQSNLDCRVQAGVTRKQLNQHLKNTGLFFPVDPGADASLGGMASTRASGTNAVRYGTMKDNVLGLSVVTASGEKISTGSRARKSASGYDLTSLYVGSEGTLGIITELQLRLYGIPESISAAVCSFPSLELAIDTVIPIIQLGIPVARIELLNQTQMIAINRYSKLNYPEQPTLFFEFHGSPITVSDIIKQVSQFAEENQGSDFQWADDHQSRSELWQARHDALPATKALRPGAEVFITDVCVPIAKLPQCILEMEQVLEASFLQSTIVGHVGDGNFHILILLNPDDKQEFNEVERINEHLVSMAIAMDGTCTGEHGIGQGKKKYMHLEHGSSINIMREIKKALDPKNIMNPGKIIPD